MNFNRRLQSLEAKVDADSVTLKLKNGTMQRVRGQALWDTAFETHRVNPYATTRAMSSDMKSKNTF